MKIFKSLKKMNKKSLSAFILSAVMLVSMSSFATLCYAWDHPADDAFNVTLYYDQYKTYSGAKQFSYVDFEGKNCSETQQCWFYCQYDLDDEQRNFKDDVKQEKIAPMSYCYHTTSSKISERPWWRLCLDPYGYVNGIYAYGWMW